MSDIGEFVGDLLRLAYARRPAGRRTLEVVRVGAGFGDLTDDTEIGADRELAEVILTAAQRSSRVSQITIEGQTPFVLPSEAKRTLEVFVDPLDGSLNYQTRGFAIGLPYTTVVTVADASSDGSSILFRDIVGAGIIDLRSGDRWVAVRAEGCVVNGKTVRTAPATAVDLKNQILLGEFYYPDNRDLLQAMFRGERGWLRNPGSAAYEMALVASGTAVAFVCGSQKNHELGAGYLLVTEAGGVAWDFDGADLGQRPYVFNAQTSVILACTLGLGHDLLARIASKR